MGLAFDFLRGSSQGVVMPVANPMLDAKQHLKEYFGFTGFRPGQEEVIARILEGRSSLAVFPTGSGKSLCYQLPALMLPGLTLVVSPLIALMKDQVESLKGRGVAAEKLDSTLTTEEVFAVYDQMYEGTLKILFVAPERMANPSFLNRLKNTRISLLAVDEAHCISEWGHAFRPDYLKIARASRELEIDLCLTLTATATPKVSEDICESFAIAQEDHVQTGFKRPNLTLNISLVEEADRDAELLRRLKQHPGEATIVYVTRQMTTEHLTTYLRRKAELRVRSYHAGMGADKRSEIQNEFMNGECDIIVATIAFGMGIDKADIRHVYHYNLPKSFENYVQETGRAGRDGVPSECHLLACEADLRVLENFVYTKRPSRDAIESLVNSCLGRTGEVALNRYGLSIAHDIKTEVIQTVLVWLELGGYVISRGWRHGVYEATLLRPFEQVLAGHSTERQVFLQELFEAGTKGRYGDKYKFEVASVAEKLGEEESRVAKSLQWLETHGDVALKPSQYLMVYEATESGLEISRREVGQQIEDHFAHWEQMELGRLQQVTDMIEQPKCIEQTVLSYFGEQSPACGKCSTCQSGGEEVTPLKAGSKMELRVEDVQLIRELAGEGHAALRSSRQMAKFLCGQTSPATTRARLTTKHDHFGVFEDYAFEDVLVNCEVVLGG